MHKGLEWHEVEFILILFYFTFCELFFYSEYWQDVRHLENIVHVALEKQQYKKRPLVLKSELTAKHQELTTGENP